MSFPLHLLGSGGRVEPGPGGGEQLHVGVGKEPVTAKPAAEQAGRHDGHALGMQATAMDVGTVDAHQAWCGAQQAADRLGFPADRLQGPLKGVVVVACQPVRALVDAAGPLLAVDDEYAGGAKNAAAAPSGNRAKRTCGAALRSPERTHPVSSRSGRSR